MLFRSMILFILLVIAYGFLVRRPMERILAERRARTSGAVEQARGAIAAAEANTTAYEDKLRAAKAEIFQARDQKLKQWNAEREAALEEVRNTTKQRVLTAKLDIEKSATDARTQIESLSGELTTKILNAVLPAGIVATEVTQ